MLSRDPGSAYHAVFVCPPLYWDIEHAKRMHLQVIARASYLLSHEELYIKNVDPMFGIRESQINIQYSGTIISYITNS